MGLAGWFKKITTGNVIFETNSLINGKIQVVEDFLGKRLVVGGLTQSGGQVERFWRKALSIINHQSSLRRQSYGASATIINHILILGLGAGTLARLVSQRWPKSKIIGVEIDPKIVEIGRKYFDLDKISNLKVVISDAAEYINHQSSIINHQSLIFVDLYLSDQFPPQCETGKFLSGLKSLLLPNGLVILNRLFYKNHKGLAEAFVSQLKKIFESVRARKIGGNLLILAGALP